MDILKNYNSVLNRISIISKSCKLIVVTKGFDVTAIMPILKAGHIDFGENKVQEAKAKWQNSLINNYNYNLHLLGHLQTNKAKEAVKLFNYIHSLDSEKLAKKLNTYELEFKINRKYFVEVNVANEKQKSGIAFEECSNFVDYCTLDLNINVVGLMCIPPQDQDPKDFFLRLRDLTIKKKLKELSIGMSKDYETAIQCGATCVRIGSAIMGERS